MYAKKLSIVYPLTSTVSVSTEILSGDPKDLSLFLVLIRVPCTCSSRMQQILQVKHAAAKLSIVSYCPRVSNSTKTENSKDLSLLRYLVLEQVPGRILYCPTTV
jgi:hypothetical protein